ncbi:hypothetical protein [Pontibacter akesuensis]|uniref:YD repeat-containing protein n=1 Tax=Pontibacter akesuensis TaxID=388950 RepID=A0A1I7J9X0_9BACT|nr:hypothetical protein [Pontibacter akesuensis]GHA71558.1 hypothetical protein GCM10007389_26410 [Pontibacter akesuensis]SFU81923.1 YD repeat-containing protein [Pontibacter akesuensis]
MNYRFIRSFFWFYTVVAFSLIACSTDEVEPNSGKPNCILLESKDSDGRITKYEYTDEGLISKVVHISGSGIDAQIDYTSYTYDSKGRIIKAEEYRGEQVAEFITYEYKDDLMIRRKLYWKDQLKLTESLFYDNEKKIIKIESDSGYLITISYNSAGNVTDKTITDGEMTFTLIYENYDDKLAAHNYELEKASPSIHAKLSKNNPQRIIAVNRSKNEEASFFIRDFSYEYNSDDLPVTIIETYPEEGAAAYIYVNRMIYKCGKF